MSRFDGAENQVDELFLFRLKVTELDSAFNCLSREQKVEELELLERLLGEMRSRISAVKELESTEEEVSNPDLACRVCNMKFKKIQFLKRHVNGHTRNSCELCKKDFARRRALVMHMKNEHKIIKAETLYTCEYCNRQFAKKPSLIAHIVSHADEKGLLACMMCGKFYATSQELETHQEEHQKACKYSCRICHRGFKRKQQYDLHMEGHEKNQCEHCHEEFSDFKLLARHTSKKHNIIIQRSVKNCKKDGEIDGSVRDFQLGRPRVPKINVVKDDWTSAHASNETVICEFCGVLFSYRQALDKHKLVCPSSPDPAEESGSSLLKCDECCRNFKSKAALARHSHVHDVQRPFLCHCGQSYKRYKHLERHLLLQHNTVIRQTDDQVLVAVCTDEAPQHFIDITQQDSTGS